MKSIIKKIYHVIHTGASYVLRAILRVLILIAFRPKCIYVSEEARRYVHEEPCVIIYNHVLEMDGAVIETGIRRHDMYFLSAKDLLDAHPLLKYFMSFCRAIPIERKQFALAWLRESRKVLNNGGCIYIAPEGKCQYDRIVKPFKEGFATLAASARVNVVPIYQDSEYHWFIGRRFRMIIGEPIMIKPAPDGLASDEMRAAREQAENVMHDLETQLNGFIRTAENAKQKPLHKL